MNLFKHFTKAVPVDNQLGSPCVGIYQALTTVPDPVFAKGMMGPGVAVVPSVNQIVAPVSGTITAIAKEKHAIGITTATGQEVLVHMGIDTVALGGNPYQVQVKVGQVIERGANLAVMDVAAVTAMQYNPIVLVIVIKANSVTITPNIKSPVTTTTILGTLD